MTTPAPSDLDTLVNTPVTVALSSGAVIEVTPIRVRELPAFIAALEPLLGMAAGGFDVMALLAHNSEAVIAATAIGLRLPRAEVDEFGMDDLVTAAVAVIEVNADFFVRRVQPALTQAQRQTIARLAGSMPSSASSPTATGSAM